MSIDKNFIVTELDTDEIEVALTEKLEGFILSKLGELASKQTNVCVEYQEYIDDNMRCFKDELRSELWIEVKFNQYKYKYNNIKHGEQVESIGAVFEYKGRKPFYINGKFVSMNVFEWIQGMVSQKSDVIYGVGKDELYDMIQDLIMDC
jgi:hypothetical protein